MLLVAMGILGNNGAGLGAKRMEWRLDTTLTYGSIYCDVTLRSGGLGLLGVLEYP